MEVCPVFVDETGVLSGSPQQQPIYGIGALVVPETRDITEALYRLHFNLVSERAAERQSIRRQISSRGVPPTLGEVNTLMHSTRHHEYKFSEVTRFNVHHYIALLNLYFSFSEPTFHAVLLNRMDARYSLSRWHGDPWAAYVSLVCDLLAERLQRQAFVIIDLQGKPDKSPVHLEDAVCAVPGVKGCLRAVSEMSVYLQLVDVLLGCVQFDLKDADGYYGATSKRAAEKRELVNFLKNRLGLQPQDRLLPEGERLREWGTPPRFTLQRGDW